MIAQTLRCSGVSAAGSAPFTISWAGLGSNEFATEEDFRTWATDIFADEVNLRRLLAAWYLSLDNGLTTPALLLNARLDLDANGALAITIGA